MRFYEYDINMLKEARMKLCKVFDFYYGVPNLRKEMNRLETIIRKLDFLLRELDERSV